jgi:hypothetical protein
MGGRVNAGLREGRPGRGKRLLPGSTTAAAATTTAATTSTAASTATTTDLAKVGVGTDVTHRGLQGVGLLGAALGLRRDVAAVVLVRSTKTSGDPLGALGKALVESLLQRIGDGADVVAIVVTIVTR